MRTIPHNCVESNYRALSTILHTISLNPGHICFVLCRLITIAPLPRHTVKPHYILPTAHATNPVHSLSTGLSSTNQIQTGGQLRFKSEEFRVFKFIAISTAI